jgi:hypothetical protein
MLTIYVSPRDQQINTVDGSCMTVKEVFVREAGGFVSLQDLEPPSDLDDLELVLVHRFFPKKLCITADVRAAMLDFLRSYHAKQDISFDCYAFANLVKGMEAHKVPYMLKYWETRALPWRLRSGSIVFFLSGENHFHHAAVYLSSGLYISVWGAGGDLEIATLKSMRRDYGAERAMLAIPKGGRDAHLRTETDCAPHAHD